MRGEQYMYMYYYNRQVRARSGALRSKLASSALRRVAAWRCDSPWLWADDILYVLGVCPHDSYIG